MYSIHLMPEGEVYDVGGFVLQSPVVPRVGEIITVYNGDTDQKLFVHQVAYQYKSPEKTKDIPLTKISILVGSKPAK